MISSFVIITLLMLMFMISVLCRRVEKLEDDIRQLRANGYFTNKEKKHE